MTDDARDAKALSLLAEIGLHPIPDPCHDGHHTDEAFTDEDLLISDRLAYFLGTMWMEEDREFHNRTSCQEWARVARALRIHGLKIVDTERK